MFHRREGERIMDHRIEGAGRAGGDDLCRVWADLAADPDNAAVAAAARAQLTALVFHVPLCDACASVSDSMPFSQKVFDVLGNIDHLGLSDEELQELRAIDDAMGDDDDLDDESMAAAVECLLAGLPEHVSAE